MSYLSQFLGAGSVLRVTSYTSGIDASVGTFNPLVAKSRVLVFLTGGGSSGTYGYNGGLVGNPSGGQGGASSGTAIFSLSLPGSVSYTIGAGGAASGGGSNAGGVSVFGQQTTASNVEPYCTYPGLPISNAANNATTSNSYNYAYYCRSGSGGSASYYSSGGSGGSGGSGAGVFNEPPHSFVNGGSGSAGFSGLCSGGAPGAVSGSVSNGSTPGYGGGGGGGGSLAINGTGKYFGLGGAGGPGYIEIWEYGV